MRVAIINLFLIGRITIEVVYSDNTTINTMVDRDFNPLGTE